MARRHTLAFLACIALPLRAWSDTYTCVSLDYPPLIQRGEYGQAEGLAVDIVTKAFNRLGHAVKVEIYPWARSLAMVRNGDADCIFTIYHSAERAQFLDFSNESIIPQIVYFYTRKDSGVTFSGDLNALKPLRIGTAHKINYGPRFEEARTQLDIDEAPTIEQNFRKLAIGRVDVVPSNLYTASAALATPELRSHASSIVKLPIPVESVASHIAFSKVKKLTALRDSFDAELSRILVSGEYRRLLEKYRIEHTPELENFLDARRKILAAIPQTERPR